MTTCPFPSAAPDRQLGGALRPRPQRVAGVSLNPKGRVDDRKSEPPPLAQIDLFS